MQETERVSRNKSNRETDEIFDVDKQLRDIENRIRYVEKMAKKEKVDNDAKKDKNKLTSMVEDIFKPKSKPVSKKKESNSEISNKQTKEKVTEQDVPMEIPQEENVIIPQVKNDDNLVHLMNAIQDLKENYPDEQMIMIPESLFISKEQVKEAIIESMPKEDWIKLIALLNVFTIEESVQLTIPKKKRNWFLKWIDGLMS